MTKFYYPVDEETTETEEGKKDYKTDGTKHD